MSPARLTIVLAIAALFPGVAPAGIAAQNDQVLAALRGETGIDPDPGTLLATVSRLSIGRTSLDEALVRLADRSQVQIAFSPSLLPADLRVDCDCAALNVAKTLDRLLADTDLGYVELGSQIVIAPKVGHEMRVRDGILRGRVRSEVAVPLEDATVHLLFVADTTEQWIAGTDRLGFFSFHDLAPGSYVLSVARIGYGPHEQDVEVASEASVQVDVTLAEQAIELGGVSAEGRRSRQRTRFEDFAAATVQELGHAELKTIPGLAEADPMRTVDVLPGVTRVSDFAASFNVRGGSADQNLILLDGVGIFNPFHALGLFSVFNADMVSRAELHSGGFPAEYGGRTSSVLRIESDLGDGELGVDAGMSLLASRAAVKGALPDNAMHRLGLASARWKVSGRRSYLDVLTRPFLEVPFPYHIQDLQAGFEGWTQGGDRIRVTSYVGQDVFNVGLLLEDEPRPKPDPDVYWNWGNGALGASWTRPLAGGGALDIHGSVSRSGADIEFAEFGESRFATRISQLSLGADLERHPGPRTRWKSGVFVNKMEYENLTEGGAPDAFSIGRGMGWGTAAYAQIDWKPSPRWLVEGGVRLDHWLPGDATTTTALSPRIAVKRFLRNGAWAVRAAGGRYTQFLHSVRDEQLPLGLDAWVLAGSQAPALVSDQLQAGVEGWLGDGDIWFASAEGYYRSYEGVVERNWAEDPGDPADDFLSGDGSSYGLDFLIRKDRGATTGWLSVSLLKADRRLPGVDRKLPSTGPGEDPAPLSKHPAVFDRRLDVDMVLRRQLRWGVVGGLRWNFGTGLPYTRPLVNYDITERQLIDLKVEPWAGETVLLGPRNAERYPVNHRLDVSFRRTWETGWGRVTPYLNVINVYNRKNVLFYTFDYRIDRTLRKGQSMMPILPTIGVEVSF